MNRKSNPFICLGTIKSNKICTELLEATRKNLIFLCKFLEKFKTYFHISRFVRDGILCATSCSLVFISAFYFLVALLSQNVIYLIFPDFAFTCFVFTIHFSGGHSSAQGLGTGLGCFAESHYQMQQRGYPRVSYGGSLCAWFVPGRSVCFL